MPVRSRSRGQLTGARRGVATAASLRESKTLTQDVRGTMSAGGSDTTSRGESSSWASRAGKAAVHGGAGVVAAGARGAAKVGVGAARFGVRQARDAVETAGQVEAEQEIRGAARKAARMAGSRLPAARGRVGRLSASAEGTAQGAMQSMDADMDASYEAGRRTERVLVERAAKPAGRLTVKVGRRGARAAARGAARVGRSTARQAARGASWTGQAVSKASNATARMVVRVAAAVKAVVVSAVGSSPMLMGASLVLVIVMLIAAILPPWLTGVQQAQSASTASTGGGSCTKSQYSLGPVKPHVEQAANLLGSMFGVDTIGGYRPGNTYDYSGHPAGLAIDLMVPISDAGKQQGQQIADYSLKNHAELGIKYVIWYQKIWSVERASEGWRAMEDRGSPTQNHVDHVHISFNQQPGTGDLAGMLNEACGNAPGQAAGGVDSAASVVGGWTFPSTGRRISSPFGMRVHPVTGEYKLHTGVDYPAACGTPIYAAAAGTVQDVRWNRAYGMLLTLNHGGNVVTRYAHSKRGNVMVKPGQQVRAGQQISKVGNAGFSTGCHLHFEVRLGGEFVDPAEWLRKQGL